MTKLMEGRAILDSWQEKVDVTVTSDQRLRIVRFLRSNRFVEDERVDYASSLLLLEGKSLRARLHVTPSIDTLGPIWRTGAISPYIRGPALRLAAEVVTDPVLQRTGCTPLTLETALEDILAALKQMAVPKEAGSDELDQLAKARAEYRQKPDSFGEVLRTYLGKHLGAVDDQVLMEWLAKQPKAAWKPPEPRPGQSAQADEKESADWRRFLKGVLELTKGRHLGAERIDPLGPAETIVIQGAGDLSFNHWNVAFWWDEGGGKVVIPEGEPYSHRRYRCLVSFKAGSDIKNIRAFLTDRPDLGAVVGDGLAMMELEFTAGEPYLRLPGAPDKLSDLWRSVSFALYGKSIIWNGEPVPKQAVADQFRDLRHIFALPNLNERQPDGRRPEGAVFFGKPQTDDVWLLEEALLRDENLVRLACSGPVSVPLKDLGTKKERIAEALKSFLYEDTEGAEIRRPGQYRWRGEARECLEVFLQPAYYPCSIVAARTPPPEGVANGDGASPADEDLLLMAWGHDFNRGRHRIWEDCGAVLGPLGARYALVIDEGQDVFHLVLEGKEEREEYLRSERSLGDITKFFRIPLARGADGRHTRRGLRASLAFFHEGGS